MSSGRGGGGSGGNPGLTAQMMGCSCAPGYYNISGLSIGGSAVIGTNINPLIAQSGAGAGGAGAGSGAGSGGDETTSNAETLLSSNAKFQAISAIAVSQDGVINVADRGKAKSKLFNPYLHNLNFD